MLVDCGGYLHQDRVMTPLAIQRTRELARASGRTKSDISLSICSDRSFLSKLTSQAHPSEPSATRMAALAEELGVSLDYLMGRNSELTVVPTNAGSALEQHASRLMSEITQVAMQRVFAAGCRPKVEDFLAWWRENSGRLDSGGRLLAYANILHTPGSEDRDVIPFQIGGNSLAARVFGSTDPDRLLDLGRTLDEESRKGLVAAYRSTSEREKEFSVSPHSIDIFRPELGQKLTVEYFRLLLPVSTADGGSYVLSFCTPV